jgi:Fe-S cluster assembly scaffold protein SufB
MFRIDHKHEDWRGIDLSFIPMFAPWQGYASALGAAPTDDAQLLFVDGNVVSIGREVQAKCTVLTMVQEGAVRFTQIICHMAIDLTVLYVHTEATQQYVLHYHNHIEIRAGITVNYQVRYQGQHHFLQILEVFHCREQAQLNYAIVSHEQPQALRIMQQLQLEVAEHGKVQIFLGLAHMLWHSFVLQAALQGQQAQVHLKGNAYLGQTACSHRIVRIKHYCSDTTSTVNLLAATTARAQFAAKIYSENAPSLKAIDMQQRCRGIVLSAMSMLSFVPALQVNAGEVQASHSVALHTLPQQAWWYLQKRGLTAADVQQTVVLNLFKAALFNFQNQNAEEACLQRLMALLR